MQVTLTVAPAKPASQDDSVLGRFLGVVPATHGLIDRFPMARNLRESLRRGQSSFFEPSVHPFNIAHPEQEIRNAGLERADLRPEFAHLLSDQLVVLQEDV